MIVAMQSSIHVARWIRLLEGAGFDIVLFPVLDAPIHPLLRNVDVLLPELVGPSTGHAAQTAAPDASQPECRLRAIGRGLAHLVSGRARHGDPRMRTPRSTRKSPLILRYPRRALLEAINIIRFGRPDAPGQVMRPPDLDPDPTRLFRTLRKSGRPWANVDEGAVRFVPLRLHVEQFGRDPRVPAQTEAAGPDGAAEVWFGPRVLAEAIAHFKPDLIHSMEFQHCAYLVLEAKGLATGRFPMWLASNWGSDIHHFAHFDDHRRRIVRVLGNLDVYAAECERDVALARNLGYAGPVFPVVPSSGGFDLAACARLRAPGPTSARRIIVVKGYQHFVGRALTALRVVADNADLLSDYDVLVYSATPDVVEAAQEIERSQGIRIRCLPRLSHQAMLAVFGRARIYLGLSASDAISTGVLESIVMGTFPIQTNTSCCNEWISDGDGGFIVDLAAPETISARLRQALQDDALVDRAAATNWETARRRLDLPTIRRTVVDAYDAALRAAPKGSAAGR